MKYIKLLAVCLLFACCGENRYRIPFDEETIRTTETSDGYVIVERYKGQNGLGYMFWKLVSITKKEKNDTILVTVEKGE